MEKEIEKKVKDLVKAFGGKYLKQTGSIGVTDRVIILPKGVTIYYEAKLKGSLSRPQRVFISELIDMGHTVIVSDDYEMIKDTILYAIENGLPSALGITIIDKKYLAQINEYRRAIGKLLHE